MSARMFNFDDVCKFIFAGNARFTIVSQKTGTRFTYRVTRKENEFKGKTYVRHFVSVLTGSDNENSYSYLGFFRPGEGYVYGGMKAKVPVGAPSAQAFDWFIRGLLSAKGQDTLAKVEFWHEGKCGRCGKTLTVPKSIENGIGPECAKFLCVAA